MTDYVPEGDGLVWRVPVGTQHVISILGRQIRQERTGTHARIDVLDNRTPLAWSSFNIERDEDRVRLANSAYQHLNGLAEKYPKTYLKTDLDGFCSGLWDAWVAGFRGEMVAGDIDPQPPLFWLEPYILQEGGTILFAPPGRGKSFLELLWAVCIDSGVCPFWPVNQARVYFINLERGKKSVKSRLGAVNRALGLPMDRPLPMMNARGRTLFDVLPAVKRDIAEYGVKHVMLDSISRAGMGDLNENRSVNTIMDGLNALSPSWSAIAHTPRASEEHVFGGIHFDAAADLEVKLLTQQDEGSSTLGIGLQITKDNDVGKRPMSVLALEFGAVLEKVRFALPREFGEIEAKRKGRMADVVRQYLLSEGATSATTTAKETGYARQSVSDLLNMGDTFVRVGREGKEVLWGVRAKPKNVTPL